MILILGSVYDDVLYFDTQLKKRREETFKDHFWRTIWSKCCVSLQYFY